jgi:hypothetical protein
MSQAVQLQTDLAGATLRKDSYLASSHAVWRSHRNIFAPASILETLWPTVAATGGALLLEMTGFRMSERCVAKSLRGFVTFVGFTCPLSPHLYISIP